MSLLWIDGFEGYGSTPGAAPAPSGIMARRYGVANEASFDIENGRLSGTYALELQTQSNIIQTPVLNSDSTIIIGLAVKFASTAASSYSFLKLYDGATLGINLRNAAGGEIALYRGSTLIDTTSGVSLSAGVWYWIELKVLVDNAAGTYELRVGESDVLSDTGVDTQEGSNAYYDMVNITSNENLTTIDDFYVANGAGSVNNNFLGNVRVAVLYPDAAGNSTDFTPSAGDNYDCVNEAVVNDDTDYVESATSTHKDLYSYDTLAELNDIVGLQINTDCRETDASSFTLVTVIRSDSTDYDDGGQVLGTTNYVTKRLISELDPATSAAWLYTGINAAEFGIKVG